METYGILEDTVGTRLVHMANGPWVRKEDAYSEINRAKVARLAAEAKVLTTEDSLRDRAATITALGEQIQLNAVSRARERANSNKLIKAANERANSAEERANSAEARASCLKGIVESRNESLRSAGAEIRSLELQARSRVAECCELSDKVLRLTAAQPDASCQKLNIHAVGRDEINLAQARISNLKEAIEHKDAEYRAMSEMVSSLRSECRALSGMDTESCIRHLASRLGDVDGFGDSLSIRHGAVTLYRHLRRGGTYSSELSEDDKVRVLTKQLDLQSKPVSPTQPSPNPVCAGNDIEFLRKMASFANGLLDSACKPR